MLPIPFVVSVFSLRRFNDEWVMAEDDIIWADTDFS
jgi:hypothetical protein